MSAIIRTAVPADAEALVSLSTRLGYPADARAIRGRLEAIGAHRAGEVLVAVAGHGEVVGFAHALPQRLLIVEPFVELAGLVVAEAARGQGFGAALLAAVESWARGQGFAGVRVRSNVLRERAHRFYQRAGYAETKRQAVFVKHFPGGPRAATKP